VARAGQSICRRHPLASVATLVLGLRCSWWPESAPMPRILGLHALPPAAKGLGVEAALKRPSGK